MLSAPLLLLLAVAPQTILGYGDGAPDSACTTMKPGHIGYEPQTENPPYTLDVSATTYKVGTAITVQITGEKYQGILLQVRKFGGNTPLGNFSYHRSHTKLLKCNHDDDSVTHANQNPKGISTLYTWNPPSGLKDMVEFVATIAQYKGTYWLNVKSSLLRPAREVDATGGSNDKSNEGARPGNSSDSDEPNKSDERKPVIALIGLLLAMTILMA